MKQPRIRGVTGLMNKIVFRFQFCLLNAVVFLLTALPASTQDTVLNRYGLWVIDSKAILQHTVQADPGKQMVSLRKHLPGIVLDLKYSGADNFMGQPLYPRITTTYLRKNAADALLAINKELRAKGLGIKVFDAYRPYSVTEKMWEPVKDDRYAADPKKGSGHNRGIAVDLTLIRLRNKKELDMGTGFDNFTDTAHHAFQQLPGTVLNNRLLLRSVMEKHGFKALDTEWWHYYFIAGKDYELLDVPFEELGK